MGFFNFFSSQKETPKQPQSSEAQLQSDMFANLSQTQKFAMVTMLASLAAAPANAEGTAMAQKMMFTDAAMMGITQDMMLNYMQTRTKPNAQMVKLLTLKFWNGLFTVVIVSLLSTKTRKHVVYFLTGGSSWGTSLMRLIALLKI